MLLNEKLLLNEYFRKVFCSSATGDLIENKIANKITSLGKTKSQKKEDERQKIYIPPEKNSRLLMT